MATRRTAMGLAVAALVIVLAACNPLPNQPTRVRSGGVSRSGWITYTSAGSERGWLEVAVRSAADAEVTVSVSGRDETRPIDPWGPPNQCFFHTDPVAAWTGGSSLGWQRVERVGPGAELVVELGAPTPGATFDLRVVDDAGVPIGDLAHELPQDLERVGGAICPPG